MGDKPVRPISFLAVFLVPRARGRDGKTRKSATLQTGDTTRTRILEGFPHPLRYAAAIRVMAIR